MDSPVEPLPLETQATSESAQPVQAEVKGVQTARHLRGARFHHMKPTLGLEVAGSLRALGGGNILPGRAQSSPTRAIHLQIDWQPAFIQSLGVLGIGPSVGVYPIFGDSRPTTGTASVFEVGGQIQYQLRYFREQPLVPVVGYAGEYLTYRFTTGQKGSLMIQGPMLGAWLLLNIFEPGAAADFYVNTGVKRSYLVAEYRRLEGANADLDISGSSIFGGLRFEF